MGSLVFGTAALGLPYGLARVASEKTVLPDEDARHLIEHALELGVSTFDTAPAYGVAEERLGRFLGHRGTVWTKVGRSFEIDASLERLHRRTLDLVQWHNWNASLAMDPDFLSTWRRLEKRRDVLRRGASTYGVEDARAAVESGFFSVVQVEFNLLNQRVVDAVAEAADRHGVEIAARSVFLQGALTDGDRVLPPSEALHDGVARARRLADTLGLRLEELALGVALRHPAIRWVLIGIDRAEQIDDAVREASMQRTLPDQLVRTLDLGGISAVDPRTW